MTSQDAFILDTGAGGIFIWMGKGATQQERLAALRNAEVSHHIEDYDVIVYIFLICTLQWYLHKWERM